MSMIRNVVRLLERSKTVCLRFNASPIKPKRWSSTAEKQVLEKPRLEIDNSPPPFNKSTWLVFAGVSVAFCYVSYVGFYGNIKESGTEFEVQVSDVPLRADIFSERLIKDVWLSRPPKKETYDMFVKATESPENQAYFIKAALPTLDPIYSALIGEPVPPVNKVGGDFPDSAQYVIVGAGTAAHSASQAIKGRDPTAKVLIIGQEPHIPYVRPPLSKMLWHVSKAKRDDYLNPEVKKSIYYESEPYYFKPSELNAQENGGVAMLMGHKVVKLDSDNKKVILDNGKKISYEKCLLATGGEPRNLQVIKDAAKEVQERTVVFRNIEDFVKLEKLSTEAKSMVVIGGGFLGSELSCALGKRGKKRGMTVHQVFPESGVLGAVLPSFLSKWTTDKVKKEGVNVLPERTVKAADFKDNKVVLTLSDNSQLEADQVVVAVGLEPNTALAESSGLEIDPIRGGFLVNSELEARSNLWVAGDAACFYDRHLGRRRVEHYDHASVSGRLAGQNMTGAALPYTHQSYFWSDLGDDVSFEAMGDIDSKLPTFNRFVQPKSDAPTEPGKETYDKGVIFYLKNDTVVGIVTWNILEKMEIARRILSEKVKSSADLNEYAKLFNDPEKSD